MSSPPPAATALPNWLVVLASVLIVFHLGAVVLGAVVAPSGPWPTPEGGQVADPPPSAALVHNHSTRQYLQAVGLNHDYHFSSNRVALPDAYLEIKLDFEDGRAPKTVRLPDPGANPIVRQRQAELIRWLVVDQPVTPLMGGERIFPPGKKPPLQPLWEMHDQRHLELVRVMEMEVPRGRPSYRPTAWSLVVVGSVARHACRAHGASGARVVRHSREALSPLGLLDRRAIPGEMGELVSDYGRFKP